MFPQGLYNKINANSIVFKSADVIFLSHNKSSPFIIGLNSILSLYSFNSLYTYKLLL
jgi:hypothetical protein